MRDPEKQLATPSPPPGDVGKMTVTMCYSAVDNWTRPFYHSQTRAELEIQHSKLSVLGQAWRLRQEDCKFQANLATKEDTVLREGREKSNNVRLCFWNFPGPHSSLLWQLLYLLFCLRNQ
jgi:hypothetical protein